MRPPLNKTPKLLTILWGIPIACGRADEYPQVHLFECGVCDLLPVIQDHQFTLPTTDIAMMYSQSKCADLV